MGQVVRNLVNKDLKAGFHSTRFNSYGLATGQYFYRIKTPEFTKVKKMLLLK